MSTTGHRFHRMAFKIRQEQTGANAHLATLPPPKKKWRHCVMLLYIVLSISYYLLQPTTTCNNIINTPTSLITSPETLHNANSLRTRCNTSNRSAADSELTVFPKRSVARSTRWILNTVVMAVVAISNNICKPNAPPPVVFSTWPFSVFLSALIACNSASNSSSRESSLLPPLQSPDPRPRAEQTTVWSLYHRTLCDGDYSPRRYIYIYDGIFSNIKKGSSRRSPFYRPGQAAIVPIYI